MTNSIKPPIWFWIVTIITLLWNLMGVMAYIMHVTMSPEAMQALPEAERNLYETTPAWATFAFAIAVWGGALGCLLLILRKALSIPVLLVSLVGILVQLYHAFFISNSIEVFGPGGMIMPIMIVLIALFLVWFARNARTKNWIG